MRFSILYYENQVEIKKARRDFNANPKYPNRLKYPPVPDKNLLVPDIRENCWYNRDNQKYLSQIESLLKMVLEADSKEYLWMTQTSSNVAKEGIFELDKQNNKIGFVIIDNEFPIYDEQGNKTGQTCSKELLYREFSGSNYLPINNFVPNFWKVFYDWADGALDHPKQIKGQNWGILSFLCEMIQQ